ncbi:Crp/Fnr family transcriptional regulator [Algiphilus sp. W345]|uniref:Crp/Fnr family transcriptional regulator n=1 Tax=Banduia mediterranea TaxID=3075609 RepID=A0ABU2WIZ0_9GAMM|nr:Crp/Fnr family transcriptional regulator [Algiphilus sp. W345]MDT0497518.1 Crp/Fnr family transcriptional regulator [Algiphilus sp. W345]
MSHADTTVSSDAANNPCSDCARAGHCLGGALTADSLHPPQVVRRVVAKGEHLYHAGDPADTLYVIRGGATKTYVCSSDGEEEVRGFQLANDAAGLESVCDRSYHTNAVALSRSWVCKLPAAAVREKMTRSPSFRDRVLSKLCHEFERLYGMLHRGRCAADQRVADFLVTQLRGQDGDIRSEIDLPMSRTDLARYLGLTTETVSRAFTRLQERGVLKRRGAHCEIVNPAALQALS